MICQRTLKNTIRATGIGMHTGDKVVVTLRPAPVDAGIVFSRTDTTPPVVIPALVGHVGDTTLATTLTAGRVRISTVEHLMAAFAGLGIDNALVEVDAAELPIMDGSAAPFVFLLQSAGIVDQDAPKKFIRIVEETVYSDGDITVRLSPYDGFRVEYTLLYDHPVFHKHTKTASVDFSSTAFVKEVSRARTFGFLADFEKLREMDLARGGSLDNAVVVDDFRILNQEGLRLEDEFVKHKILDAIGDLYLLGHSVIGAFSGYKSGHASNNALLRKVLANRNAWDIVTFDAEREPPPISFARPVFG
ncbi:MAG TPA: UDP-3-O-acyl-N-acetylglucosamine deacetylase [Pseudomonadales bacterium]|nr:UDP-3-O-acyl-N-acetylglucosamine deacetylase [Pseudomonadales bacterium]